MAEADRLKAVHRTAAVCHGCAAGVSAASSACVFPHATSCSCSNRSVCTKHLARARARVAPRPAQVLGATRACALRRGGWVALSLARALHFLHRHGIAHLGVSPACVLLAPDGAARLGDLGAARLLGPHTRPADPARPRRGTRLRRRCCLPSWALPCCHGTARCCACQAGARLGVWGARAHARAARARPSHACIPSCARAA